MVKFNGRLFFKQYMKSKPTPWGIKVWCSADPTSGYLLDFNVYTGKAQQPIKGGLGHHVVMTVGAKYLKKGHHFYHDNFFTSVELAESLLDLQTHSCGTICMNHKGWPTELKISKKERPGPEDGRSEDDAARRHGGCCLALARQVHHRRPLHQHPAHHGLCTSSDWQRSTTAEGHFTVDSDLQ